MSETDVDRVIVETRLANEGPNTLVAYLLWFFLGYFGVHRFYLGRPGTAILQLLLCLIVIGVVWWVIDLFLIPRMLEERRAELRARLTEEVEGVAPPPPPSGSQSAGRTTRPRFAYVRAR